MAAMRDANAEDTNVHTIEKSFTLLNITLEHSIVKCWNDLKHKPISNTRSYDNAVHIAPQGFHEFRYHIATRPQADHNFKEHTFGVHYMAVQRGSHVGRSISSSTK